MTDGAIRDMMERSIDDLPDELRTVFVACIVNGMELEHCADIFALTPEMLEARLHDARNLLVEVLVRRLSAAVDSVYELDDDRAERITSAVMDRIMPR